VDRSNKADFTTRRYAVSHGSSGHHTINSTAKSSDALPAPPSSTITQRVFSLRVASAVIVSCRRSRCRVLKVVLDLEPKLVVGKWGVALTALLHPLYADFIQPEIGLLMLEKFCYRLRLRRESTGVSKRLGGCCISCCAIAKLPTDAGARTMGSHSLVPVSQTTNITDRKVYSERFVRGISSFSCQHLHKVLKDSFKGSKQGSPVLQAVDRESCSIVGRQHSLIKGLTPCNWTSGKNVASHARLPPEKWVQNELVHTVFQVYKRSKRGPKLYVQLMYRLVRGTVTSSDRPPGKQD